MNNLKEYLNKTININIDKPLGSKNKEYQYIYPVNYGYVNNEEVFSNKRINCYLLGIFEEVSNYTGKCIAIVHRIDDNNDSLIIVPEEKTYSNKEIDALIEFQEKYFKHIIIKDEIEFNSLIPELSVKDINKSIEFYKTLGFKVLYERKESKFVFLELENNQIMIEEINDNWNVGKLEYPYGRGINISMTIDNVLGYYKILEEKNTTFFKKLEVHKYRVDNTIYEDKEFLIQDIDGYLLRFNN